MTIILLFSAAPHLFLCIQKQPVFITSLPSWKVFFVFPWPLTSHPNARDMIFGIKWRVWTQSLTRSVCHVKPFTHFQMGLLRMRLRSNKYRLSPVPMWFPHNFGKNHRYFFTVTNVWHLNLVNATEIVDIWRRHTHRILAFVLRSEGPLSQGKVQWVAKWCL